MDIRRVSGTIEQRQHKRIYGKDRQLQIKSGRQEGNTSNWSHGGFLADGLDEYDVDDNVEGVMEGPDHRSGHFSGKMVRVQDDGQRTVQLVSFDSSALLAMQGAESDE